jgi:hypothetical protein
MNYNKKYIKYKKKYLELKYELYGGEKEDINKLTSPLTIDEINEKLEIAYNSGIDKLTEKGNITFQLDRIRPNTVESLFVLDTTNKKYEIKSYFDDDDIIKKVNELRDANLYWSGITIDGYYFLKYNTITLYISYNPIYINPININFIEGTNNNNISLNINPSASSIIHLLYRIWDISDIIKISLTLPNRNSIIYFDRNNIKSKFYHNKISNINDNDGIWNLFDNEEKNN